MSLDTTSKQLVGNEYIFLDYKRFQQRLQIDQEFFEQLKNKDDLFSVVYSKGNENQEAKYELNEVFSTMNGIGQLSFAMMIAVQTTGWTPGSLERLRVKELNLDLMLNEKKQITKNVASIKTDSLLGLMACSILELLIIPCIKIAYADGDFSMDERILIVQLLSEEWGYHEAFIEQLITEIEPQLLHFSYEDFAHNIREICKIFPEINYDESKDELISVVKKVVLADGIIHPNEQAELDSFTEYLTQDDKGRQKRFQKNSLWDNIFKNKDEDDDISVIEILKRIPLFEHLTKRELKTISQLVHQRVYQPGEYMFQKDQPGAAMFIIKKGAVNIVLPGSGDEEIHLATLKAGSFVGELALLDNSPRSASAKVSENTLALAFFRSELNKLLKTYPTIGSKIMRKLALIIGQRLKATNEQLYKR